MENLEKITAETLLNTFGNKYPVYESFIKSDFEMPAFLIEPIVSSEKHFMGNKFMKSYSVVIKFYCESSEKNELYPEICEKSGRALEYLSIDGDLIRGNKLSFKNHAEYLEISVCYEYFFFKKYSVPYMETLDIRKKEEMHNGQQC